MTIPASLGRGIVIRAGQPVPELWAAAPRFSLEGGQLEQPEALVLQLHAHWLERRAVVIELGVEAARLQDPEVCPAEVFDVPPDFTFARERLHFLVWANNYDATREGEPVWWLTRLARRAGCAEIDDPSQGDVLLQGSACWCDGGPRGTVPVPCLHRESLTMAPPRLGLTLPGTAVAEPVDAELAPDQAAAAWSLSPAARVLAPAGSGKTRTLVARSAFLAARGLESNRITVLAYNKRAALELRSRGTHEQARVSTLHALGYGLLREARGVRVATPGEQRGVLAGLVRPAAMANQDPLQPYLDALSRVRMELVSPTEVETSSSDIAGFARVFQLYREALQERNWVDHDEQIYGAVELLLRNPELRRQARQRCAHLLVDEFQDLTPALLLMVRLLAAPAFQLFAVGDDDQVIYGYAGASPRFLVNFERYVPGAESHVLSCNYRCPAGVVKAASHLLSHNRVRVEKQIAFLGQGEPPRLLLAPQPGQVAELALAELQGWLENASPDQMVVLARTNAALMPLQVALAAAGIPFTGPLDVTVLERTGVRSALAYLRLALHPDAWQRDDLADALRRPQRMLKREIMEEASRCRNAQELRRLAARQPGWAGEKLGEFCEDVARLGRARARGAAAVLTALRTQTEFISALDQLDQSGLQQGGGHSHKDDLLALERAAALFSGPADEFEAWLRESLSRPADPDGLRLSSIHRVKGMEWDRVMIFGVETGQFPHHLNEDLEEERRVLHVALTRARRECVLVASATLLSPLLGELNRSQAD